jgi:hypothetical protein
MTLKIFQKTVLPRRTCLSGVGGIGPATRTSFMVANVGAGCIWCGASGVSPQTGYRLLPGTYLAVREGDGNFVRDPSSFSYAYIYRSGGSGGGGFHKNNVYAICCPAVTGQIAFLECD